MPSTHANATSRSAKQLLLPIQRMAQRAFFSAPRTRTRGEPSACVSTGAGRCTAPPRATRFLCTHERRGWCRVHGRACPARPCRGCTAPTAGHTSRCAHSQWRTGTRKRHAARGLAPLRVHGRRGRARRGQGKRVSSRCRACHHCTVGARAPTHAPCMNRAERFSSTMPSEAAKNAST